MTASALLSRLDRVKPTGQNRWIARCPAHDDKNPSLAIRETEDGRVLVHCFAGCSAGEIVSAAGLELSDLFPPRPLSDGRPPERRPFSAADALRCLNFEAHIVHQTALFLASGQTLTEAHIERLALAVERIESALGVAL